MADRVSKVHKVRKVNQATLDHKEELVSPGNQETMERQDRQDPRERKE
jgi:hypothetical protein